MESPWQQVQNRLSSDDPEYTYDDVCGWSSDDFDALKRSGIIVEIALATRVVCDACPAGHWERVRCSEDGKRAFIPCPVAGIVDVNLERLRRWRGSHQDFAGGISKALSHGEVQPLPASRLWFLGRRRTGGHTPYFFFAAIGPDELSATIKAVRQAYGDVTGMVFVPYPSPAVIEGGKLRVVDVGKAVSFQDGRISVDFQFVEEQFGGDGVLAKAKKQAPKSLEEHHRAILRKYMEAEKIHNMEALGTHLRADRSVLYAMVRGDKSKYSETRLGVILKKLGCSRAQWDRVPPPVKRK